jgi:hypothetical protein
MKGTVLTLVPPLIRFIYHCGINKGMRGNQDRVISLAL